MASWTVQQMQVEQNVENKFAREMCDCFKNQGDIILGETELEEWDTLKEKDENNVINDTDYSLNIVKRGITSH